MKPLNIIHLEDNLDWQIIIQTTLKRIHEPYRLSAATNIPELLQLLQSCEGPTILICDLDLRSNATERMRDFSGLVWLLENAGHFLNEEGVEIFVVSGFLDSSSRFLIQSKGISDAHIYDKGLGWNDDKFLVTLRESIKKLMPVTSHSLQPARFFVSYSHEDRQWLEKFQIMLTPILRSNSTVIQVWDDRQINPGASWEESIKQSLHTANFAILLVSSHFLASSFIMDEELPTTLKLAELGQLTLLWVAVSDSLYDETALRKYQALNDPKQPLDTLSEPDRVKELARICRKIRSMIST